METWDFSANLKGSDFGDMINLETKTNKRFGFISSFTFKSLDKEPRNQKKSQK